MNNLDMNFLKGIIFPASVVVGSLAVVVGFIVSLGEDGEKPSGMKDGFYHALYECPSGNFSGFARWTGFKGKPSQEHNKWALYNEHRRYIIQIDSRCTVAILEGTPSIGSKENDP